MPPKSFMDRHLQLRRYPSLFLLFFFLFIISFHYTTAVGSTAEEEEPQQLQEKLHSEEGKISRAPIIEMVQRMFSFPANLPLAPPAWSWGSKLINSLINRGNAYFSPPTVDFRDSQEAAQAKDGGGATAAGGRMKDAVLKSLDKSKATMEDTAKSAAKLAGDAVHKTKNKVKRTFSFGDGDQAVQQDEEL